MYPGFLFWKQIQTMNILIEWITASLGLSSVQLTLQQNSTKRPMMPAIWARSSKVVHQDHIQLLYSPYVPKVFWNG